MIMIVKLLKSSINVLLVIKYISFDLSQNFVKSFTMKEILVCLKMMKINFTPKSKNYDLQYFSVFSILIIYISRLLSSTM